MLRWMLIAACVASSGCSLLVTETTFGDGGAAGADAGSPPDAAGTDAGDRDAGEPFDAGPDATVGLCTADSDCSDGAFCNGEERCDSGDAMADDRGCVGAAATACPSPMTCDEAEDRCGPVEGTFREDLGAIVADVTTDDAGNVYVVGCIFGDTSVGGPTLTVAGMRAGFVAAYEPSGAHRWSHAFGGDDTMGDVSYPNRDCATSVAVDSDGRVYVRGSVSDGMPDFGGGPVVVDSGSTGVVVAYDSFGSFQWMTPSEGSDFSGRLIVASLADGSETVVSLTTFRGTTEIGARMLSGDGSSDFYVARLDRLTGNVLHVEWGRGAGDDFASDAAVIGNSIYVVGGMEGGMVGTTEVATDGQDALVARFGGSDLSVEDVIAYGGSGTDYFTTAVSAGAHLYAAGAADSSFEMASGIEVTVVDGTDGFLADLEVASGSLTPRWARTMSGIGDDRVSAVVLDSDTPTRVVVGGMFQEDVDVGAGAVSSDGDFDLFTAAYSVVDGAHTWSHSFGSMGSDNYVAIDRLPTGALILGVSVFGDGASFGGSTLGSGRSHVLTLQP